MDSGSLILGRSGGLVGSAIVASRASTGALLCAALAALAAWVTFGELAATDSQTGARIGVLASPLWLATCELAALIGAAAIRLRTPRALTLLLTLVVVVPWLPPAVPDVLLLWTGPAAGLIWAAVAISLIAAPSERWIGRGTARWVRSSRTAPALAIAAALIVFLAPRIPWQMPNSCCRGQLVRPPALASPSLHYPGCTPD
jgi:hypothetical protein